MKKLMSFLFVVLMMTAASPVMAEHQHRDTDEKACALIDGKCAKGDSCEKCSSKENQCGCPIISKIMKKTRFFLANAEEIGLSEDQVKQIKVIMTDTKKAIIRMEADMKIGKMDFESMLDETPVNVAGLNTMIDQGMAGMATGAKASVETYAKLKGILSDAQMAKAKAIWKKKG